MGPIQDIVNAWIVGRQIDFGSVTMSFIDMVDSSIRLQVNNRLIQVIIPSSFQLVGCPSSSTSSTGEVFLVTGVECTLDELFEHMLMTLNEKLERIAIQPDSLCQVLDYLLLALQKYERAQKSLKREAENVRFESQSSLTEEKCPHLGDAHDSDNDGSLSAVEECDMVGDSDDNSPDHYGYDLATCENVGSAAAYVQYTTTGFLYVMAESARLQCDLARDMVKTEGVASGALEKFSSLQWCHVIPDPKTLTVYLLIHVGGIVRDDSLALAAGISVDSPVKISLLFDRNLWVQKEKGLLKPFNEECKVTQDFSARIIDYVEESNKQTHTMSYGNGVLLPKLVHVYFQFLSNDTVMLDEELKSPKLFDELRRFTSMENTFVGLLCFLCARIKALQDWCIVCWNSLPYSVCRLRTCDKELCLFTFEELGVGTPVLQEVQTVPEIIDFELSLALVAARSGRDVFEPFPTFLLQKEQLRGRSGFFSKAQRVDSSSTPSMTAAARVSALQVHAAESTSSFCSNKNMSILQAVLSSIPPVEAMRNCRDEANLRNTLNSVWDKKMATGCQTADNKRPEQLEIPSWVKVKSLPYSVLRYVLSTSRLKLHLLDPSERFSFFDSYYQFVILHDSPEREAYFESQRIQKGGSFFAFHGSSADNWYSILRNGLRCLSNTSLMSAGAAYGSGIYFGSLLEISLRFSTQKGSGWSHGLLKEGFSVLAICEIINGSVRNGEESSSFNFGMSHRGVMVVPPEYEKDVAIRYIIVLVGQHGRAQVSINRTVMTGNIDLMRHYLALRSSYGAQQENQRKVRSIDRFRYMCELCGQSREREEQCKELIQSVDTIVEKQIDHPEVKGSSQDASFSAGTRKPAASTGSSTGAMQAIAREYKNIVKQINEAKERTCNITNADLSVLAGIEVILPDETNICRWHVNLSQFLFKSFPLFKDLVDCARQWGLPEVSVKLECTFPETYPFSPPFVRVVSPRFSFHTGHVTVGGSICMELLTGSGWSPVYTFESVIVQVMNAIIEGGGRLDKRAVATRSEYSEREAREAFKRVARDHGWS